MRRRTLIRRFCTSIGPSVSRHRFVVEVERAEGAQITEQLIAEHIAHGVDEHVEMLNADGAFGPEQAYDWRLVSVSRVIVALTVEEE